MERLNDVQGFLQNLFGQEGMNHDTQTKMVHHAIDEHVKEAMEFMDSHGPDANEHYSPLADTIWGLTKDKIESQEEALLFLASLKYFTRMFQDEIADGEHWGWTKESKDDKDDEIVWYAVCRGDYFQEEHPGIATLGIQRKHTKDLYTQQKELAQAFLRGNEEEDESIIEMGILYAYVGSLEAAEEIEGIDRTGFLKPLFVRITNDAIRDAFNELRR